MKTKDLERLKSDFIKYCEQIGIVDKLYLVTNRKEMHSILINAGRPKRCAGWGECFSDLKTIFVDAGLRIHYPSRQYAHWRKPDREYVKHKSKYIDFRNTLVHELVHYRWPKLRHGWRYEKRIQEILRGTRFDAMNPSMAKAKKEYDGRLDYYL
jgi:hypothetical protein